MKTIIETVQFPTTHSTRTEHNARMVASYPIQVSALSEDEGGGFQALFPLLARSVVGYGETSQEAIADLQIAVPLFLKTMAKTEQTLPEAPAEKDWEEYSGKFNVRVAKMLHAQLVELAEDQGVSLNSLVQTVLASGATALSAGKMFGAIEQTNTKQEALDSWHEDIALDVAPFLSEKRFATRQTFLGERIVSNFLYAQESDRRLNSA